jgi:hypothetical protein
MTINKAQGQTLKRVGIHPPSPIFFIAAFSRPSSFDNVTVAIIEGHRQRIENDRFITLNILY